MESCIHGTMLIILFLNNTDFQVELLHEQLPPLSWSANNVWGDKGDTPCHSLACRQYCNPEKHYEDKPGPASWSLLFLVMWPWVTCEPLWNRPARVPILSKAILTARKDKSRISELDPKKTHFSVHKTQKRFGLPHFMVLFPLWCWRLCL